MSLTQSLQINSDRITQVSEKYAIYYIDYLNSATPAKPGSVITGSLASNIGRSNSTVAG